MENSKQRLFCIRVHPKKEAHAIIAVIAASEAEAMKLAQARRTFGKDAATVIDCGDNNSLYVTFSLEEPDSGTARKA